jgi:hypothetical protein
MNKRRVKTGPVALPLPVLRERVGERVSSLAAKNKNPLPHPLPEYRERESWFLIQLV